MKKPDSNHSNFILLGEYCSLAGGTALSISSGHIDPLVRSLSLKQQKETVENCFHRPGFKPSSVPGDYLFFLLDSYENFEPENPEKWFQQEMTNPGFASSIRSEYIPINQKLIETVLGKREADPAMLFRAISDFQFIRFRTMIPESITDTWIEGQLSNEYYLKLFGLGGRFSTGITHQSYRESLQQRWGKHITWIK